LNLDLKVIGYSQDLSCVLLYDDVSSSEIREVYVIDYVGAIGYIQDKIMLSNKLIT